MIKLIIFDLDGTLVDLKDVHYEALNKALVEVGSVPISRDEHLSKFDGLNTNTKLEILGLTNKKQIFDLKQKYTIDLVKQLKRNEALGDCLYQLGKKYKLCVASNSIRNTIRQALLSTGYITQISWWLGNEDVKNPKPATEIYLECMIKANVSPKETLIIEDSYNGRLGAEQTGALVMGVNSVEDVTCENIDKFIKMEKKEKIKWKDPKLNILIPMAGNGSRFSAAGYTFPKPLIEVHGKPMIQVVVENLNIEANYIYIVQKEHYEKYNLKTLLNLITPGCKIVVKETTEIKGAAVDTLLAKDYIDNDAPLLIANSDQFVEWNSGEFMYSMMGDQVDGGILTFKATHPKWSFAQTNDLGFVTRVAEKNPISDTATCGIYFWKRGEDYIDSVHCMMHDESKKVNNEYYIAPTFNELVGPKKIKIFNINKMWGIGTPEDLKYFVENYKL